MIQDIYPHILYNQYDAQAVPGPDSLVLSFDEKSAVLSGLDGELHFPTVAELGVDNDYTYLFSIDKASYYYTGRTGHVPEGYEYRSVRDIRYSGVGPKYQIFAANTGKHLADWYRDTRYCGRCGSSMKHSDTERAMKCPDCGNTVYPRIMPAVIVGVINGDRLLLTRYRTGFGHNALVAGFTEIGETLEQTVEREVMEETGIRVKNIRYYKSQPWGIANDILAGFYCEVDGDDNIHMDKTELKYAEWVERSEIVLQPDDSSLTNEMMKMFMEGKITEQRQ